MKKNSILSLLLSLLLAFAFSQTLLAESGAVQGNEKNEKVKRGAYLVGLAGCMACHTADDGEPLTGGRPIITPYGTFYSSNITPHKDTGIGKWREEDMIRALRYGKNPYGKHYYPAFPYNSYTKMRKEDMQAIYAYLMTVSPVREANQTHRLPWYLSRLTMMVWKWLNFRAGEWQPLTTENSLWNQGQYLTDAILHCGECHTPRNFMGGLKNNQYLQGDEKGFADSAGSAASPVPAIPGRKDPALTWLPSDWETFLSMGMTKEGDFVGGSMGKVIDATMTLTPEDQQALIEYLSHLPKVD